MSRGQLADPLRREVGREHAAVLAARDGRALRDEQVAEAGQVGRAHPGRAAGAAITSAIVACCTSLPRWMITTRSTVWATSARTWLETRIVRPSAASERRKSAAT